MMYDVTGLGLLGKEIEIEWIDDEKRQLKVGRISGD